MRRGERGGAQRPEARAALTEVQELLHGERGRREARIEVHLARNAPFRRRAGARVRGEASAGAGAEGARSWAGRGGSAQQSCQPHAEPAEEPEPRAPGGRSARGRAVREGRGEPRGGDPSAAVTAVAAAPVAGARPRRRRAGSREEGRRGARGRPRCPSRSRRGGAEPGERRADARAGSRRAREAARPRGHLPSPRPVPAAGRKARGGRGVPGREVALAGWRIPLPTPFWNESHLSASSALPASAKRHHGPAFRSQTTQCPSASAFQKLFSAMQAPHLQVKKLRPRELQEPTLAKQWHLNTNSEH